jgi:putative heme-binding domain-containing protein
MDKKRISLFILCCMTGTVLSTLPQVLNAQGNAPAGAKIFATNCAGCHGSDGRGGERAPNIATVRNISSLTDSELASIVSKGVSGSGMPAFGFLGEQGIADVVAALRVLQGKTNEVVVSGDPAVGRSLFFGSGGCSKCHMMHGEGGFLASDLSDYGSGIAPERVRSAIVAPEASLPPASEVIKVETSRGEHLRGVLRSEDNFNLVLQTEDGRYHRFVKDGLKKLVRTEHSLMPTDYGTRLSQKELDDLVSYLVRSATPIDPASRRRRRGN